MTGNPLIYNDNYCWGADTGVSKASGSNNVQVVQLQESRLILDVVLTETITKPLY